MSLLAELELGTVGEWVAGAVTAVGVAFAAVQLRELRRGAERERLALQEANARSVVGELASVSSGPGRSAEVEVVVDNGGDYPIFEAQVRLVAAGRLLLEERVGTVRPRATRALRVANARLGNVDRNAISVDVVFLDAFAVVWRSGSGTLERMGPTADV